MNLKIVEISSFYRENSAGMFEAPIRRLASFLEMAELKIL